MFLTCDIPTYCYSLIKADTSYRETLAGDKAEARSNGIWGGHSMTFAHSAKFPRNPQTSQVRVRAKTSVIDVNNFCMRDKGT